MIRAALAACVGVAAALLVACGSSGGLIPSGYAGPLQTDFENVANAAKTGNGDCSATEAALAQTEQDFSALPSSVDASLRSTLRQGIANLRVQASALCAQPVAQTTTTPSVRTTPTTTTPTTTPTTTTPTTTTPTTTTPTTTTPTTTTPSGPGGGTVAPPKEEPAQGGGSGPEGATGGVGAGGQEAK